MSVAVRFADLVGSLFAQCAQVDRRPRAVGTPGLGNLRQRPVRAVTLDDLSVQAPLVAWQDVRGVGSTQHQLGRERPEAIDLLDRLHGVGGVDRPQCGAVEAPVERGVGDGMQVLGLTAGQIEVQGAENSWSRECPVVAMAVDEVAPESSGLHDTDALRQHRPGRGLGGWKPHGRNPGS